MRLTLKFLVVLQLLVLSLGTTKAQALTLSELRQVPNMTPEKFASYFKDFKFQFHAEVQDADIFLKSKSGDCDDYATVAADVLSRAGFTPRMVAVRMKGETHVVCYIEETHSYLDYNYRKEASPLIPSDGSLIDVANKVAASFERGWIATYEFTFGQGVKRLVNNILPNPSLKTEKKG
ncbi:MAG: hypothetical protein JWM04_863 [Verrucomicrobiales bacterium]|jgi:hypothetical protein|nr:hypothetical protein [Verrucomicrobiales bacterium]